MQRDQTIDIAKAIAIVAIVFGHVWRGVYAAGIGPNEVVFGAVDSVIYMWHLSVFAFVAGLFVQRGMTRDKPWRYARDRDIEFLWLYVVWSLIQGLVRFAIGSFANNPPSLIEVFELWYPEGQMWFFGWIALMMVLAALLQPWRSRGRAVATTALVALLSAATWGINGDLIFTRGLALSIFFWIALLWRGDRVGGLAQRIGPGVALSVWLLAAPLATCISLSSLALTPTSDFALRTPAEVLLGFIASALGVVAVFALARLLALSALSKPAAYIGRTTMAIFVAHIIFTSGTRIVLAELGADNLAIQLLAGTIAGVAGPIALSLVATRLGANWLFGAPPQLIPGRGRR